MQSENQLKLFQRNILKGASEILKNQQNRVINSAECVFSPLIILLWIHGNLFPARKPPERKTWLTIIILIYISISECLMLNHLYHLFKNDNAGSKSTRNKAFIFVWFMNWIIRIIFYLRSDKLQELIRRLAEIYSKVSVETESLKTFKKKLIVLLAAYEVSRLVELGVACYFDEHSAKENFQYGFIPSPYSSPIFIATRYIKHWSFMELAVACYFCSICYLLKETLSNCTPK